MKQEQALSEVIGFLMIIALLGILFSMYLLYVVPLQGRDSEISHIAQVKEQFTGLTLDINTLIVNEKLDYPIQRVITLGSGQGGSTGAFSIFPVQSYSGSSGTLTVDTNNPELGTISFRLRGTGTRSVYRGGPVNADYVNNNIVIPGDTESDILIDPQSFFLIYHVADHDDPANESDIINISSSPNWSVIAKVIPHYDPDYVNVTRNPVPGDLTITVKKGENTTIDNLTVKKYVERNHDYTINLYDWTYGLGDVLGETNNITYRANAVAERGPFPIGQVKYPEQSVKDVQTDHDFGPIGGVDQRTHPLSMFSFQSNNKYWINQEYQYQWGSSFVNQSEGTASIFLPPLNIQMNGGIIYVDIIDINVKTHNDFIPRTSIGGTQNNPVIITLSDLTGTINEYELLDGVSNSKYFLITTSGFPDYERKKWRGVFSTIFDNSKRTSGGLITDKNIAITDKPLDAGITSTSLMIAWDDTPGFDLTSIINDPSYPTLQDVIDEFNNDDGVSDIDENNLKVSYKKANITFSLYNLGQ